VRRVFVDGEDRTAEALRGMRRLAGKRTSTDGEPEWTAESIELLGAIPNYYLLYYYETEAMLRHQHSSPTRASEVMAIEERLMAKYADPHLDTKPPELAKRGGAYYSEAAAELMADLVRGAGTEHVVNAPNRGAIPGLPDDVVVEVSARVGSDGVTTLPMPALRPDVDALMRTMKDVELLTVEAAVNGDHAAAMRALAAHPLGPSMSQAPAVWQRLREVHAGWLGRLEQ
jgi:6-phospho-beta-glucosidase